MRCGAAAISCLLLLPTLSRAQSAAPPAATRTRSSYWREVIEPASAQAERLLQQGRALLAPAAGMALLLGPGGAGERRRELEGARARFERALELAPSLHEARLELGKTLAALDDPSAPPGPRGQRARGELEQLRATAPLFEAQEVAFQLALLATRAGELARAQAEYERALAWLSDDDELATLLGNLAEVTMLSGDLPRALALYERAVVVGRDSARVLARWGLAVTLDRLGERELALREARRATREDRAPRAVLHQPGVFFSPPHELAYYEGLGQLALVHEEAEGVESLEARLFRARVALAGKRPKLVSSALEQALRELAESGRTPLAQQLADALLGRAARPIEPPEGEEPAEDRDLRVLLAGLRALRAFALFLRHEGEHGRFHDDARAHLAQLERGLRP